MNKLILLPFCCFFSLSATTPSDLVKTLKGNTDCKLEATVEVELPMASDNQVLYDVQGSSLAQLSDTLLPLAYNVNWTLPTPMGESNGFTSYFNGNLYRFRDGSRLQEYHFDENPTPFVTGPSPVQKSAQFVELLPYFIGCELEEILSDSTFMVQWFPDTVFQGSEAAVLKTKRIINDMEVGNTVYVFSRKELNPIQVEKEMSPGTVSEQTVTVNYKSVGPDSSSPLAEEDLIALYPVVFSDYRQDSYRLANLVGKPLPSFSLPKLDGERYSRSRGDSFNSPAVLVFLDENVASTPDVITQVRSAVASAPINIDVFFAFLSNRQEEITEIVGKIPFGETILISARNIVKDFGVTETPALVFVSRDGTVTDVYTGFNNSLSEIVINKAAIAL